MKKLFRLATLLLFIALMVLASTPVQAGRNLQEVTPTAANQLDDDPENRIMFSALGIQQSAFLQGPLAQATLPFSLPPEWKLSPGASVHLDVNVLISNFMVGQEVYNLDDVNAGKLTVTLNGIVLGSEMLQGGGMHSIDITIPDYALEASLQELAIEWDALSSCNQNIAANISVNSTSYLYLPHESISPPLRLDAYPWPFYLPNNPLAHPVALVLEDGASLPVVQGAVQVATSLGRISQGGMGLSVITASQLDEAKYANSNLILIGKEDAFANLGAHTVPIPPDPADGILELLISPWNSERVALLVTGANDDAVLKAASALSIGQVVTASDDSTAFVSELWQPVEPVFKQDQLFSDLGVGVLEYTSFGVSSQEVKFSIPSGKSIGADAYLDLNYNHSQLLDYLRSSIQVSINGIPIGSIRLGDASSNLTTVRLIIPASAIKTGMNNLSLTVEITPRSACTDPRTGNLYITIFPDSFLHLPVTDNPIVSTAPFGLGAFPDSFLNRELDSSIFLLAVDDPASWVSAGELAFVMGAEDTGGSFFPLVDFGETGETIDYSLGHYIVIGQPGRAPAIATLDGVMPMPFDATGQLTPEAQARLAYSIDATRSTGYLELAESPSLPSAFILMVAGNNDQGLGWAANAMTTENLRETMQGDNFAVVQTGTSIKSEYVQPVASASGEEPLPGVTPVPTELAGTSTELPPRQDLWAIPVIIVSVLAIIGLIIWEVVSWKKKK